MNPGIQQGFVFRRKTEKIDWRKLASIDVDYIVRTVDFETLQDILLNVTFCNIEAELANEHIDPNFIKLYKLSQLIIEYLLQSQEFIFSNVNEISQDLSKEKEENARLRNEDIVKLQNTIGEMKKELQNRRNIITMQQHIIKNGKESVNKCLYCPKTFMSQQLLQSHVIRRHTDLQSLEFEQNEFLVEKRIPDKVQDEDFRIKLEKMQEEWHKQFQQNLNELSDRLKRAEERNEKIKTPREKKNELQETNDLYLKEHMDRLKEDQKKIYETELKRMQTSFMKELKEMNEKQLKITDELERIKETRIGGSMIGILQDDPDMDMVEQRKQEMKQMKNQFNKDLKSMQIKLEKQLEQKYNEKINQMEAAYKLKLKNFFQEAKEQKKLLKFSDNIPYKNIEEDIQIFENTIPSIDSVEDSEVEQTISMENVDKYLQNNMLEKENNKKYLNIDYKKPNANIKKAKISKSQMMQSSESKPEVLTSTKNKKLKTHVKNEENKMIIPPFKKGKSTPELLALAKAELDNRLESIRIPKTATQLPDTHYKSIISVLDGHKIELKQKYPNFEAIRGKCFNVINQKSKKIFEHILLKKSQSANKKIVNLSSTLPPKAPSYIGNKHLESASKVKANSLQNLAHETSTLKTTAGSSHNQTLPFNDNNSEEDNEDNSDQESSLDNFDNDESEDDSISNIDVDRSNNEKVKIIEENNTELQQLSVKDKTKQIENQLQMRSIKKPTGGIDTINQSKVSFSSDIKKIVDEDAFSLTDISLQEPEKPIPKSRSTINAKNSINSNLGYGNDLKKDGAGSWDESD